MTVTIGRRELLAALSGVVTAWPLAARAEQPALPVVGFLNTRSADVSSHLVAALRQYDRIPALAAELANRPMAVLVATGGETANGQWRVAFASRHACMKFSFVIVASQASQKNTNTSRPSSTT